MDNNKYEFNGKTYDSFKVLKIATQSRIRTLESVIRLVKGKDEDKYEKLEQKLAQMREDIKDIKPIPKPIYKYFCKYCIRRSKTKTDIEGILKHFRINTEQCFVCKARDKSIF